MSGQLTCSSTKCVITLMAAANAAPGKDYSFLLLDTKKNQFKTGVAVEVVSGTPTFTPKTISNVSLGVTIADEGPPRLPNLPSMAVSLCRIVYRRPPNRSRLSAGCVRLPPAPPAAPPSVTAIPSGLLLLTLSSKTTLSRHRSSLVWGSTQAKLLLPTRVRINSQPRQSIRAPLIPGMPIRTPAGGRCTGKRTMLMG